MWSINWYVSVIHGLLYSGHCYPKTEAGDSFFPGLHPRPCAVLQRGGAELEGEGQGAGERAVEDETRTSPVSATGNCSHLPTPTRLVYIKGLLHPQLLW